MAKRLSDIETGEEKEFEAIKDAAEYLAPIWNMKVNSIETSLRMKQDYGNQSMEMNTIITGSVYQKKLNRK